HHCTFELLFSFNDTPPTDTYTLSLHDALPISLDPPIGMMVIPWPAMPMLPPPAGGGPPAASCAAICASRTRSESTIAVFAESVIDRKSTRLNSSHDQISYAVFCLKKKKYTQS